MEELLDILVGEPLDILAQEEEPLDIQEQGEGHRDNLVLGEELLDSLVGEPLDNLEQEEEPPGRQEEELRDNLVLEREPPDIQEQEEGHQDNLVGDILAEGEELQDIRVFVLEEGEEQA